MLRVYRYIFLLILLPPFCKAQIITTIAGTGTAGYNGDGIPATSAQLNFPNGLALDAAGNIFITDLLSNRIRKIDAGTGIISTIAGTGTGGYNGDGILAVNAQVSGPTALAFDGNGDLFFVDRANQRVRKITMSSGIISTVAGTGTVGYNGDGIAATTAQLNFPHDLAFEVNGNLYITDGSNNRVRKIDMTTGIISTIAGTGISGYNGDGIPATSAQLANPSGIIFDNAGNIFITEFAGSRIRKITKSTGLISTIAGTGVAGYNGDGIAATTAQLNNCWSARFDAAENMYLGDAGNNRVRQITKSTGIISTVAGTGGGGYNGDGILAVNAQINSCFNTYFDQVNCDLYIADAGNNRIRKVTGGFAGCPSPVAPGNLISCQTLPAVAINNANKNSWVPIFDSSGNIAAMINANGNILGTVNTSLYTKTGPCREDGNYRLYLNRNITITPQNQPSTPVSVRLYILKAELDSLKTAVNSQSQPSGVASINEVDVFKNNDACITIGANTALPLAATAGTYNSDFYLQVNVSSFSSFYFANKSLPAILPVKIKSFTGKQVGSLHELIWEVDCFDRVVFNVERSADGIRFNSIGIISAEKTDCSKVFYFTDKNRLPGNNYYRLHIVEASGTASYSPVVLLNSKTAVSIRLMNDQRRNAPLEIELFTETDAPIELLCMDVTGRVLLRRRVYVLNGSSRLVIDMGNVAKGIYWVYAVCKENRSNVVKFVK